jgi:tetraacyldisaccharide 4'-kinase
VPVICVGNLSTGGTGKTPIVISIVRMLQESGKTVGVLTRGYKGKRRQAVPAGKSGLRTKVTARDVGDEPFLMVEKLEGAHILIGPDRSKSARTAVEELGCTVLVMDDGFQHWAMARDLDIVLLDVTRPFALDHRLPWGNLREDWSALGRAQVACVTKAFDRAARERATERARRQNPDIAVWQAEFRAGEIKRLSDIKTIEPQALDAQPVLLVAGLASPDGFERTARDLGCRIEGRYFYADHFAYPDLVIRYIETQAERAGVTAILTTEKDAVKLRGRTSKAAPWTVVSVETHWLDPAPKEIRRFLKERVKG